MSEINFTQRDIIDTAMRQSAVDMGCSPEDFLKTEPVIVPSRVHSGARAYLEEPLFFDIASYGSNGNMRRARTLRAVLRRRQFTDSTLSSRNMVRRYIIWRYIICLTSRL